jgi:hypothetical protein
MTGSGEIRLIREIRPIRSHAVTWLLGRRIDGPDRE